MATISIEPISSAQDIDKIVEIVLFRSLFTKEFYVSDFEWDEDELYSSFIETVTDSDTRSAYLAERDLALTEAKELVISSVQEKLKEISIFLGDDCPFFVHQGDDLFLLFEKVDRMTPIGAVYMASIIFFAMSHRTPWVNVDKETKALCNSSFSTLFEYASCVSLSGWTASKIWYLGRSRSIQKLMRILNGFCSFVGASSMRDIKDLDKYVQNSNDGGVDVLGVTAPNGILAAAPMIYLLGATIQKSNRKDKVIGQSEKARFRALFDKTPQIGFEGVMSVPFLEDDIDKDFCRDADCRYFHHTAVFEGMLKLRGDPVLSGLLRPQYVAIKRWTKKASSHLALDMDASLLGIG